MLVTVFGVPTEFSMFGVRVLRALMEAAFPGSHYVHADTLNVLQHSVEGRKFNNIILYSEFPESNLIEVAGRISRKFIVFYEMPDIVVNYSVNVRNSSFMEGVRYASKNIALISIPIANEGSLILKYSKNLTLIDMINEICSYLEIPKSSYIYERVAADLGLNGMEYIRKSISIVLPIVVQESYCQDRDNITLNSEEMSTLQSIIPSDADISEGGILREIIWDGNIFFEQNKRREMCALDGGWIEMLGPSRFICFGPYLFIPQGEWSVKAEYRVRGNQSGNRVEFDVVQDGAVLALSTFDIPASGMFEVVTELVIDQPERPLEFRVHMREGAIDGQLFLDRVRWRHGAGAFQLLGEVSPVF